MQKVSKIPNKAVQPELYLKWEKMNLKSGVLNLKVLSNVSDFNNHKTAMYQKKEAAIWQPPGIYGGIRD